LSHSWADSIPEKAQLLQENIATFSELINISDLPKTFTEAIDMTRRLDVPYLWTDSLCIVQDSVGDWSHESSAMRDIYAKCYYNLAITGSLDSAGGLLRDRNPLVDIALDGQIAVFIC
jgi:hypothetical protein